jgi:hypothetical protein
MDQFFYKEFFKPLKNAIGQLVFNIQNICMILQENKQGLKDYNI